MTRRDQSNPIADHALLRYIERVQGFDVEKIRNKMATGNVRAACKLGAKKVIINGMEFRISPDGVVRTVVDSSNNRKRAKGYTDGTKRSSKNRGRKQRMTTQQRHGHK